MLPVQTISLIIAGKTFTKESINHLWMIVQRLTGKET